MTLTIINICLFFGFGVTGSIAWLSINENIELRRDLNRLMGEIRHLKKLLEDEP